MAEVTEETFSAVQADVKLELAKAQRHLLRIIQADGANFYQAEAAARSFALISGTLSSVVPPQQPSK